MFRKLVLIVFIFFRTCPTFAQPETPDVEELFKHAQNLAFSNQWKEARAFAQQALVINPKYFDAKVLIGRTFAWEQKYDSARLEIMPVITSDTAHCDALDAMIDIEFWSKNYPEALKWCNIALTFYPNNRDILLKKAQILIAMGNDEEARAILALLLGLDPNSYEVNALLASMHKYRNRIALEHTFDFFREPYTHRWHMTSLQYQRDEKWGTIIGKCNMAQLVTANEWYPSNAGFQAEVDAYPIIRPGTYLYLNGGISLSTLFPFLRFGFEPFQSLGKGWEVSAGGRYLFYDTNLMASKVTILTGSISKYFSNNWLSFRPYWAMTSSNFSQSYFVFYRHYLGIPENYIGGALGVGLSPDENYNRTAYYGNSSLSSYRFRFDIQHKLSKQFILRCLTGYTYEKYTYKKYRNRFDTSVYLAFLF